MGKHQILRSWAFGLASLLCLGSCTDESLAYNTLQPTEIMLRSTDAYTHSLGYLQPGESPYYIARPQHERYTGITVEADGEHIYHYAPATDFSGVDEVIIALSPTESETAEGLDMIHLVFTVERD